MIRELAAGQHGVVARRQLLAAGIPVHAIDNRVRRRGLEPLHRGVYRVGPLAHPRERELAAVLACGDGALLSHRSAASLWDLVPPPPRDAPVEVSVTGGHPRGGAGVRVHRIGNMEEDEADSVQGVPATSPARTLLDLAAVGAPAELERAVARGERNGCVSPDEVRALLRRYPRRPGTSALRHILHRPGGAALTRSEAEAILLELVRRARLPEPRTNARLKGYEVDFLWRPARLVVEVDGYAFHSSPRMFERDRRRDRALATAGFTVMRVTLRELREEPEAVLAQVAQALISRRA